MNTTVLKSFIVNHDNVAVDVWTDVIQKMRVRWERGKKGLATQELQKEKRTIERQVEEVKALSRVMRFPELRNFINLPSEELQHGVDLLIRHHQTEQLKKALDHSRIIEHSVARAGLRNSEYLLKPTKEQFEVQYKQNQQQLGSRNLSDLIQKAKHHQRSVYHQLLHWLHLNGKATRDVQEYLSLEVNYKVRKTVAEFIEKRILDRFLNSDIPPVDSFRLPEECPLRNELEEIFLNAETDEQGAQVLSDTIQSRFPEIFEETLWPRIKNDLAFDWEVNQLLIEARGLIIKSPFASRLRCIADYLHVNPGHTKFIQTDKRKTEFVMFGVATSFHNIPAISNLIQREERRMEEDEDRRFYARSVEDVFPQKYREYQGVTKEYGAFILAKAYVLTDALEVFRAKGLKITLNYPEGRKSFLSFDNFISEISYEEEKFVHDGFWKQFADDGVETITTIDNWIGGRIGSGEPVARFHAIKDFVGAGNWELALKKLLYQTKKVDSYY